MTNKRLDNDYVLKNLEIFLNEYNSKSKEKYWNNKSQEFYDFWNNKIRNKDYKLKQDDTDYLVRIIDSKARGHKAGEEAIARTGIYQGLWEKALNNLKDDKDLQNSFDKIVNTSEVEDLIPLINQFLLVNKNNKNGLSGSGANMINAFLFLKNPNMFLSVLSLKHRKLIMKKFNLGDPGAYKTQAERIVKSSLDIVNNFNRKYNVDLTPRSLSEFLYTPHGEFNINIKDIWYEGSAFKYHAVGRGRKKHKVKISELKVEKLDSERGHGVNPKKNNHIRTAEDAKNEQENRSAKGLRGEDLVVEIEKQRLISEGQFDLAKKVKRVSDDWSLGYDVLSYDSKDKERYIEVKSTSGNLNHNQFYITKNELEKSESIKNYYIYFVYKIDTTPEVRFLRSPDLNDVELFNLIPQNYLVEYKKRVKSKII